MRSSTRSLVAALLVLAAGVTGAASAAPSPADGATVAPATDGSAAANATPSHDAPAENATIGYFGGYWYDTPIDVDQSDGLSDAESRAYVRRTMARVEVLRDRNFEHAVPVDVLARSDYRNDTSGGSVDAAHSRWNQQVWEAALILGDDTNLSAATQTYYSNNVQGFYSSSSDEIKIIVPSGKNAHIDHATLAHELVHALQDQHYDLTDAKYNPDTQDAQLATSGLIEGEARYVETKYTERCDGEWSCVATPARDSSSGSSSSSSGDSSASPPQSLQITLYFPYASGPGYVSDLVDSGGWAAVNDAWADPPTTTTEIIHGDAPPERSLSLARGAATNGWRTFPEQGVNGADSLGEASAFVGLWWQSTQYGADVVPRSAIQGDGEYRSLRFDAAATDGWVTDRVLPYQRDREYGFVWKSAWESETDAREFADAYVGALKAHDAVRENGTWVVPDGGYAGAYRVVHQNDTVTIVNGPTVADVNDIRPSLADAASANGASSWPVPGVGLLGAALAVLLAVAVRGLRGR